VLSWNNPKVLDPAWCFLRIVIFCASQKQKKYKNAKIGKYLSNKWALICPNQLNAKKRESTEVVSLPTIQNQFEGQSYQADQESLKIKRS